MRFSYVESMTDPGFYLPLARAVEEAGWDGFAVPDSICYPEHSDTKYPYTPDGSREFLENKPFLEPFSLIPALGAVTERLRFTTFVVKLPIRNPVLVAKAASTVAVLTDDRFVFGVGVSPWPDDYRAVGVPWERRGKRMDEMIEVLRGLTAPAPDDEWSGRFFEYHGEFFDIPSLKLCPVPRRPIPLLIGGHSDVALRRAARVADGWMHAGGAPEDLSAMLGRLGQLRKEYGRENDPFEVHVISMDAYTPDGVRRLEDLGVTDVIVGFRNSYQLEKDTQTLEQKLTALRGYAENVIAKAR